MGRSNCASIFPPVPAGNDCRGALYQDDGHTFAYQKGEILRGQLFVSDFEQLRNGGKQHREEMRFRPWWKERGN